MVELLQIVTIDQVTLIQQEKTRKRSITFLRKTKVLLKLGNCLFRRGLATSHNETSLGPTVKLLSYCTVLLLTSSVPELYLDLPALDLQSP